MDLSSALTAFGGLLAMLTGTYAVLRFIRWANRYWTGTLGRPPAAETLAQLDSALATGAERQAARALFHLGFDQLERRSGALRAVKFYSAQLPELEVLRRAPTELGVLRSGIGT